MGLVTSTATQAARTYQVRTYGCQMNVHDSERLAGLLEAAGYRRAAKGADADVVVFNTCAVRENADNKLYGNLSHLVPRKQADPNMQIAVGGAPVARRFQQACQPFGVVHVHLTAVCAHLVGAHVKGRRCHGPMVRAAIRRLSSGLLSCRQAARSLGKV